MAAPSSPLATDMSSSGIWTPVNLGFVSNTGNAYSKQKTGILHKPNGNFNQSKNYPKV
jgi:hypothetical protein